jgi:cytoskeleton protein RodZ
MGSLGERLKREREARGISLEEIARKTRISVRSLHAIEEERFDLLPGGIFNKSFIRQYADFLGLDGEQSAREYARKTAAVQEAQAPPPPKPLPLSERAVWIVRAALGATAIGIVIAVVWLLLPKSPPAADSHRAPTEVAAGSLAKTPGASPAASGDEKALQPASRPPSAALQASAAPSSAKSPAAPLIEAPKKMLPAPIEAANLLADDTNQEHLAGEMPEELLLQINAHSTVWISITADGEKQWQGTMEANQRRQVQANETIRLTVGNAGGVELTLNGKDLGALGNEGEVKTVTLAARALQEPVP